MCHGFKQFIDPLHKWLLYQAEQSQHQARAPGTNSNYNTDVKTYLAYCHRFGVHPPTPTVPDVCIYLHYISTFLKSPASIANYVSLVLRYIKDRDGDDSPFYAHRVTLALDAFYRQKNHKVNQMLPLTQQQVTSTSLRQLATYTTSHLHYTSCTTRKAGSERSPHRHPLPLTRYVM